MIDTAVGTLNVPELEALVSLNVELAGRYQAIADDRDAEPQARQTAQALAVWRRARARYFQEECAETERVEAASEPDLCKLSPASAEPEQCDDRPEYPGVPRVPKPHPTSRPPRAA
jgi:hypothetical protein